MKVTWRPLASIWCLALTRQKERENSWNSSRSAPDQRMTHGDEAVLTDWRCSPPSKVPDTICRTSQSTHLCSCPCRKCRQKDFFTITSRQSNLTYTCKQIRFLNVIEMWFYVAVEIRRTLVTTFTQVKRNRSKNNRRSNLDTYPHVQRLFGFHSGNKLCNKRFLSLRWDNIMKTTP